MSKQKATLEQRGTFWVLKLPAILDINQEEPLNEFFAKVVAHDASKLILDFSGCEYSDTRGFGILFLLSQAAKEASVDFVLAGLTGQPLVILNQYHVMDQFRIIPSVDDAFDG